MTLPEWLWLYPGLPLGIQLACVLALSLIVATVVDTLLLAVAASRERNRELPEVRESDYLWVFLVPALNEQVTIADSVARLEAARATHKVILVIDDGSDDATPEILADLTTGVLAVLRRDLPEARRGKAAALNAAWRHVHQLLRESDYERWRPQDVLVVVIDADGRLSPDAPHWLARHFDDPRMGGVQSLVRIYNRRGWLTWAQDVEFAVFGRLYQSGRSWWGTANMGGNGQANRLAALDTVVEGDGPWRNRLTEDQDVGVRLLQNGWKGAQDLESTVSQQGLSSLRRLYRQRTRWSQGSWESLTLLRGLRRVDCRWPARVGMWFYLLTPVIQTVIGVGLATAVVLAVVTDLPLWGTSWQIAVFFLSLSFLSGAIGLLSTARGLGAKSLAVVLLVPYVIYSWLIFPVVIRALLRVLMGRSSWAKTAREPLESGLHAEVEPDP